MGENNFVNLTKSHRAPARCITATGPRSTGNAVPNVTRIDYGRIVRALYFSLRVFNFSRCTASLYRAVLIFSHGLLIIFYLLTSSRVCVCALISCKRPYYSCVCSSSLSRIINEGNVCPLSFVTVSYIYIERVRTVT